MKDIYSTIETEIRQPVTVHIPDIMTANTYFWRPASNANGRRRNEQRRNQEVAAFVIANKAALETAGIEIEFSYSESCNHVYKTCKITKHGKRSNIIAVRNALRA